MLFDLQGKRKTFIKIVYAFLAIVFTISFVGFGIGSDAAGGLFDAFGIGGGGGGGHGGANVSNPQYEQQIETAEARLETDPGDQRAHLEIARAHFLAASDQVETDESGAAVITDDARANLEASVAAWQDYLELEPKKPDPDAARLAVESYIRLEDAAGAAAAQQIRVDADPTAAALGELAFYLYAGGEFKKADRVAKRALAKTPKAERAALKQQLDTVAEQARQAQQQQQQQQQQQGGGDAPNPLEDPLGGAPAP